MILSVEVTQRNINSGASYDSAFCPIALALHDKGLKNVVVNHVLLWNNCEVGEFDDEERRFMHNFDERNERDLLPDPFTFELEMNPEVGIMIKSVMRHNKKLAKRRKNL